MLWEAGAKHPAKRFGYMHASARSQCLFVSSEADCCSSVRSSIIVDPASTFSSFFSYSPTNKSTDGFQNPLNDLLSTLQIDINYNIDFLFID